MTSPTRLLLGIALVLAPSLASAKGAAKKEPPKPLPSYEDVMNSYSDGVPLCPTESNTVGGDDQGLTLEGGLIVTGRVGDRRGGVQDAPWL